MKRLFVLFIFLFTCEKDNDCYENYYQTITDYSVNPNATTPKGIQVDTGGYQVDLARIDGRIDKIWSCIQDVTAINPIPQPEWQCLKTKFSPDEKLKRDCLVIKMVKPFYTNLKCSEENWQFIGYDEKSTEGLKAPDALCEAKGLKPSKECPCMWRTAIQNENIIITPPDIYLWEIGRLTSCNNVWHSPFAKCLSF